ncbi:MAG: class D sortase [Bryobacteraceae bacterium]|nr:class D sortase [Bryobacteraceae bacterium]
MFAILAGGILAGWGTAGYLAPPSAAIEDAATVRIPRLSLRLPIQPDDSETSLRQGAGHVRGTAKPGEPGNVALAGHRDTHFRPLRHIQKGDEVWLETPRSRVLYRVFETRVVDPADTQVLAPRTTNTLTLITCYPFQFVGHAPQRFIAVAREEAQLNPANPLTP